MIGRSLVEIWSSEMADLAEDTWSEVSLGSCGMAIVVVETVLLCCYNYLLLFGARHQKLQKL